MSTIKNYDSRLTLSEYRVNEVYSFYIHNVGLDRLVKIREEDFNHQIEILNNTIENNKDSIPNNKRVMNFIRSIGIVVDKHQSNHSRDIDYLTVMFKINDDYVLNRYVVNSNK